MPRSISEKCLRRFTISVPTSILFKQSQTDHGSCDDTQCPRWNTGTGRKLSKTCRTSPKYIKYSDFGRRKKVLRGHEAHGNFHNGFRCDRHESLCWMLQFRAADDQPPLSGPVVAYEEFIGAKKHLVLGAVSHTGPPQGSEPMYTE